MASSRAAIFGNDWGGQRHDATDTTISHDPHLGKLKPCPTGFERSNRPAAANCAEETLRAFVVAKWEAALRKTDKTMVRNARV